MRLAAESVTFRDQAERLRVEYDRSAALGGAAASKKGKKPPAAAGRRAFQEDLDKEVGGVTPQPYPGIQQELDRVMLDSTVDPGKHLLLGSVVFHTTPHFLTPHTPH